MHRHLKKVVKLFDKNQEETQQISYVEDFRFLQHCIHLNSKSSGMQHADSATVSLQLYFFYFKRTYDIDVPFAASKQHCLEMLKEVYWTVGKPNNTYVFLDELKDFTEVYHWKTQSNTCNSVEKMVLQFNQNIPVIGYIEKNTRKLVIFYSYNFKEKKLYYINPEDSSSGSITAGYMEEGVVDETLVAVPCWNAA
jgi:hypothetical protein